MNNNKNKIIIATGGTGGHIFPAVSLRNYLSEAGFNLILTTDKRGLNFIDSIDVKNIKIINSSKLNKKNIIVSIIRVFFSIFSSLIFLLKNRPKFIFGMGGYASFPVCFAAILLKIPFIIYESNLLMGKTNRYLTPFAKKIFVSYKEVEGIKTKYNHKIIVVGNILREKILNYSKTNETDTETKLNLRDLNSTFNTELENFGVNGQTIPEST